MKLEVGMYVRYEIFDGIHKITKINKIDEYVPQSGQLYLKTDMCVKSNVIKASHNIIDLIEVGDYVNGYKVYEIIEYEDNTRAIVIADDNKSIIWEESSQYIKSIVTKEQFESMSYKVGE